jgi:hypothetical protein
MGKGGQSFLDENSVKRSLDAATSRASSICAWENRPPWGTSEPEQQKDVQLTRTRNIQNKNKMGTHMD